MKITEIKNEDAIELLGDLLEPAMSIFADEELRAMIGNKPAVRIAQYLLKNHKEAIFEVLAITNGKTVEEYTCNPITVLLEVIQLLNDEELVDFFTSQAGEMSQMFSTEPVENTEVVGK